RVNDLETRLLGQAAEAPLGVQVEVARRVELTPVRAVAAPSLVRERQAHAEPAVLRHDAAELVEPRVLLRHVLAAVAQEDDIRALAGFRERTPDEKPGLRARAVRNERVHAFEPSKAVAVEQREEKTRAATDLEDRAFEAHPRALQPAVRLEIAEQLGHAEP